MKRIISVCILTLLWISFFAGNFSSAQEDSKWVEQTSVRTDCAEDTVCKTNDPKTHCVDSECVCDPSVTCCGVSLSTNVPFIGNCIELGSQDDSTGNTTKVTDATAFPVLMWSLTKILVSVILIVCFVLIVIWGIMISVGKAAEGRKMIMRVVIWMALLWASGVILRLINPNFFG